MPWLEDFTDLLLDADQLQARWRRVLASASSSGTSALNEAWRLAGMTNGKSPDPAASLAVVPAILAEIRQAPETARPMLQRTLAAIHGGLHRLEREVVLPLDFDGKLLHVAQHGAFVYTLGEAAALPAGHALAAAVPAENRYMQEGKPYFVLGPSVTPHTGGNYPADFYELADAVGLTVKWAAVEQARLSAYALGLAVETAASEARRLLR